MSCRLTVVGCDHWLPWGTTLLLFMTCAQLLGQDAPPVSSGPVDQFQRQSLTPVYFSEGVAVGDLNADGAADVVYGPNWFAGPQFKESHEIYPPQPQNREAYADHFFAWVHDFNGDRYGDILVVGFPGTPAHVYENPGPSTNGESPGGNHWKKHEVFDWVSNESPHFTDLTGDGQPELICTRDGVFGYASPVPGGFETWPFTRISGKFADERFGHGLGIGDVDGDGRNDVLTKDGWFQQPPKVSRGPWDFHVFTFAEAGGADMFAYDVNGDGLNDVITSVDAHAYGLVWWEQQRSAAGEISFQQHLIMGSKPSDNDYGIHVSELHSVKMADIDGDGLQDIVTGKTYWSHHRKSPEWDAGAVVYWFQLKRSADGVHWIPRMIDDRSGIGRQIVVADVNADKLPDIAVGGMLGCHVLKHSRELLSGAAFDASQPHPRRELAQDLSGIEAAKQMTVPEGFQVQLAAAEPDVHQPVALAIDDRGRVWIAEAYTYPLRAPEGQGLDKIIILEDTNQDGRLDQRKVFAENLNLVSGLEVGFGGVWVGAAPYLLFIPDANADDVPDGPPQVLLDGFGFEDTHEVLNGFNWGPDGWLYGCHGIFTHSKVGPPGTPEAQRIRLNASIWRYHPTRHQFEVFAEGTSNPWGVDFDDYGQAFATACVIPHLFHIVQGARYQRQAGQHFNPYTFDDIKTIADHSHYAGDIGDHAWWGHEPGIKDDTSDAGGGHAHCGALVYLGDNWPERYRNSIFFNNIHGNRVNMDRLTRQGSGYVGRHGDDLLLANDRWFRGINLRCGPDGSVYLIDWYDRNACHRVNPEIWDRTNGRVYNISYGTPTRGSVDLGRQDDTALARLALHANDWYARMSRRLLQQRAATGHLDSAKVRQEIGLLLAHADATRVLRGMWLGHATGLLTEDDFQRLRAHASPYVVAWSIQLQCELGRISDEAIRAFVELGQQSQLDPLVRLYLAAALQRLPHDQRWDLVAALSENANDAPDQNLPLMIWYGLEPLVTQDPVRAIQIGKSSPIPLIGQFVARRAAAEPAALELLLSEMADMEPAAQSSILEQILLAFEGSVDVPMPQGWEIAYARWLKYDDVGLRDRADRLAVVFGDQRVFPALRATLANAAQPLEVRQRALEILIRGRDRDAAPALYSALNTSELQSAAIRALAAFANAETPRVLVEAYPRLNEGARSDAIATLVSRAEFAQALLDAVETQAIPRADVHAFHIRQMSAMGDERLMKRVAQSWGTVADSSAEQKEIIARLKSQMTSEILADADRGHGRMIFQKTCAACHTIFGAGEKIGPDLTGSNRADLDYILENLVAPNVIVGKDYLMTIFQLIDGRVVSGLVTKETDSAYTVKLINDSVVIAKGDIDEQHASTLSLMPNGLLDNLTPNDIHDLVGYLGSPGQVALRGPKADLDPGSGKAPGAFEGESLKVLEKTAGQVSSQDMKSFKSDRWSGDNHLWWTEAKPGAKLSVELNVADAGRYELQAVLTMARDYGIVQLYWDGEKLGPPIDLFNNPDVITTGVLSLTTREVTAGTHRLTLEIVGTNPSAVPAYMVALDFFHLEPSPASR